jgi:NADPH:quinone reductase-like Zn-dependent oxidoreductase
MKAVVFEEYGPPEVLQLKEVEKPIPRENEILVKVHAASVNAADWHTVRGTPFLVRIMHGFQKPRPKARILGDDMAGQVEAVGSNVTQFKPSDKVFGFSNFDAFAEYCCVPEDNLVLKPDDLSYEHASTLPIAGITALQGLRAKGDIQPGTEVLVVGASGGVGSFAVQIAKSFGAEVTGVCSTGKMDLVSSIGADHVVDYKQEDFTAEGKSYDLILAIAGNHAISVYRRALNPQGIYVCVGGSMSQYIQALLFGPLISLTSNKNMGVVFPMPNKKDLEFLAELVITGKIVPVIARQYALREVPEAVRYLEDGHAQGKLVISINPQG